MTLYLFASCNEGICKYFRVTMEIITQTPNYLNLPRQKSTINVCCFSIRIINPFYYYKINHLSVFRVPPADCLIGQ